MPTGHYNHKKTKTPIYTQDRNQKIRQYRLGRPLKIETRKKMSEIRKGDKSHFWKGGVSLQNRTNRANIMGGIEYSLWRKSVFERDNFMCQKYRTTGGKIVAHHINNFSDYPERILAIDNGVTLSEKAHKEFHKTYGKKNNTLEQLVDFLNNN